MLFHEICVILLNDLCFISTVGECQFGANEICVILLNDLCFVSTGSEC